MKNVQHVSHPIVPHQQIATPQGVQAFGACFKCGLPGHMAKNCPTWQPNQGASQQQCSQGQHNFTYGRVNHVTAEEAQQSQDRVLGIFLANSHPATIYLIPEHHIPSYHQNLLQSIIYQSPS
jgi:hypothetical protein